MNYHLVKVFPQLNEIQHKIIFLAILIHMTQGFITFKMISERTGITSNLMEIVVLHGFAWDIHRLVPQTLS